MRPTRATETARGLATGALAASLVLGSSQMATAAAEVPMTDFGYRVQVDVSLESDLSGRAMTLLRAEVERIWAPYGVGFTWDAAGDGVADERLRLTIADPETDRPQVSAAHTALAWIWFDTPTRPGREIQASVAAARRMVSGVRPGGRSLRLFPGMEETLLGRALGRSIAHEVGHFLLASPQHTDAGLMRAIFVPDDLLRFDEEDYALAPAELRSLSSTTGLLPPVDPPPALES